MNNGSMSRTVRLTVGQAMVRYLQVQYTERDGQRRRLIPGMFGIFGHGNVAGLGEALYHSADDMPYYQGRNEQAMVHLAAAYAKASLRLSTFACAASIGPGSTNMITGAAGATINRLPVLLLPADIYISRRQGPVMQQVEHPTGGDVSVNDCFRPISRFFDRVVTPEQLLTALPEAMRVLASPVETGAVTLAVPQDVYTYAWEFPRRFFEPRSWRVERQLPDPQRIAEVAELLAAAERPVIIAGGGVIYSEATPQLVELAETVGVPVVETFAGKGAVPVDEWYAVGGVGTHGNPAAAQVLREADLVIAVGTRLMDVTTGSQSVFGNGNVQFVSINVTDKDARKQGATPVIADARLALTELLSAMRASGACTSARYREEVANHRDHWRVQRASLLRPTEGEVMSQAELIGVINEVARPGDTVVTAAGTPPGDLLQLWDNANGSHCDLEYGNSCMGYEIPAGLGVRMARPNNDVFVLVGDGSYLMNPTELVTAMAEKLKVIVIVSDNHGFQSVHRVQQARTGISFGNEFRLRDPGTNRPEGEFFEVDIAKTAEGFGARACRVSDVQGLRSALAEAQAHDGPSVIVAVTETYRRVADSTVWWDIAPAEVSADQPTREARARYEKSRAELQRFHG
jgi:3D-(3,5/4)-trihydroxycyclohexane-1,2-dione acylhydrolase (decyclizing)